jgi:hypothetical protein
LQRYTGAAIRHCNKEYGRWIPRSAFGFGPLVADTQQRNARSRAEWSILAITDISASPSCLYWQRQYSITQLDYVPAGNTPEAAEADAYISDQNMSPDWRGPGASAVLAARESGENSRGALRMSYRHVLRVVNLAGA